MLACLAKAGGHVAEIRERIVTTFKALEWLVFVDGSLTESQMFHGARLDRYQSELEIRIAQFTDAGWIEDVGSTESGPKSSGPWVCDRYNWDRFLASQTRHQPAGAIGTVKKNVVPAPGTLSAQMRPPCRRTIDREI